MPGSRVLLVDRDIDALAELAARLRERGVRVSLASGARMACDRARTGGYDVVLAARALAEPEDGGLGVFDAMSLELTDPPQLLVLDDRDDVDRIVARIEQLARPQDRPRRTSHEPSAHALEHAPLGDLLLVLGAERRSGTVTVTTSMGSGEARLVEGEVVDAVYVRLEGLKAITRMLGERDGTATFTPGAPAIMRRMEVRTPQLVRDARTLAARAAELRSQTGDLASGALVATDGWSPPGLSEVERQVIARLRVPTALGDLLDALPHADAEILESVLRLDAGGGLKRLGDASTRVQLCGPDQLHLVRASAARARAPGFAGPARLVFAATPARLAVFGHTVLSLADAFPSTEAAPAAPVPYVVATIRLGDGIELEVVALPLVPAYAPLWPMALAGAAVLVRLDEGAAEPLYEACASVGVPILDAGVIFGGLDEASAAQVASLIRTALQADGTSAQ